MPSLNFSEKNICTTWAFLQDILPSSCELLLELANQAVSWPVTYKSNASVNSKYVYPPPPQQGIPQGDDLKYCKLCIVGNLTENFACQAGHLTIQETLASSLKLNYLVILYWTYCLRRFSVFVKATLV